MPIFAYSNIACEIYHNLFWGANLLFREEQTIGEDELRNFEKNSMLDSNEVNKMNKTFFVIFILVIAGIIGTTVWRTQAEEKDAGKQASSTQKYTVVKTDAEWKEILSPEAYNVLRHHSTERPNTSPWNHIKESGEFQCAGCDLPLFKTADKFDSGTGWPSFSQPVSSKAVGTQVDRSLLVARTEVHCSRCGGHLGHVFSDGPKPTGKRYCINGVSLKFNHENP